MDCAGELSCAIGDLIDRLSNPIWDWPNFFATLIATVVGALIGAIAILLVFVNERRERARAFELERRDRKADIDAERIVQRTLELDNAAVRLMETLGERSEALREYQRLYIASWADGVPPGSPPAGTAMFNALEVLALRASAGDDRKIALAVRETVYELTFIVDFDWAASELNAVVRVVRLWRSGARSMKETLASLDRIDERREAKRTDSAEMPPDVEPFERRARD